MNDVTKLTQYEIAQLSIDLSNRIREADSLDALFKEIDTELYEDEVFR